MKKKKNKKNLLKSNLDSRTIIIIAITIIAFLCIILRILYLNVFMSNYYKMKLNNEKDIYAYGESVPRGRILDRNGKVLVDNQSIKSIIYQKPDNITTKEEIKISYQISKILTLEYSKLTERNKKEFYILINKEKTDKLITKEEYQKLENRKLTENEIYELKIKRITKNDLKTMTKKDNQAAYVFYLMNKGYFYDQKIIKKDKVTDKEYAYFSENTSSLAGFSTSITWERTYPYGDTLRTIFGKVSSTETGLPKEEAKESAE